ncbi:hypothetical protein [Methanobacterium ferruginis]|uniref:hypothetical protein n=1 Tax=Methanobacterium ferruginis TaxID=710191 RepID=UPI00257372F5|nr:hypothetical protein [Methanobacterium ferruginis]BDZ69116.1 hypothetical protein GCM10025860_25640 [Methanobacterium ferruginis]
MALKGDKFSKSVFSKSKGYLFCNHCGGYYKLKESESHRDFEKCECGNPLELVKTKKALDLKIYNLNQNKEVLDQFETAMLERRENLKNFFPHIDIDDKFIQEMQEEEDFWDIIDQKSEFDSQKKYLDIILEQERLMTQINEKKIKIKNPSFTDKIITFYEKTDPIILLGVIIFILIIILILTVLMGWV